MYEIYVQTTKNSVTSYKYARAKVINFVAPKPSLIGVNECHFIFQLLNFNP